VGPGAAGEFPAGERAQGQEGAVREVQHAHQAVDQAQPGGHQEVERAQPQAGDGQQDDGAHFCAPFRSVRVSGAAASSLWPASTSSPCPPSAWTPSSRWVRSSLSKNSSALAVVWTTLPPESTTAPAASWRTTCRFCSTSRIGTVSAARSSVSATSCTI